MADDRGDHAVESGEMDKHAATGHVCNFCKERGMQVQAFGFCIDCGDHLCQECVQNHFKTKLTMSHALVTMKQIAAGEVPVMTKDKCTDVCTKHTDEIVKYYCPKHEEFGCTVCMTVDHRNCKGVDYIPDAAVGLDESVEIVKMLNDIDTLKSQAEKVVKASQMNSGKAETICVEAKDAMKTFGDDLTNRVQQVIKRAGENAEKIRNVDIEQMTKANNTADLMIKKMQSLKNKLASQKQLKQHCKLFISMKQAKQELKCLQESIESLQKKNIKIYKFEPCANLVSSLSSAYRSTEGSTILSSMPLQPNEPTAEPNVKRQKTQHTDTMVATSEDNNGEVAQPEIVFEATHIGDAFVGHDYISREATSNIGASVMLKNNLVVAVDIKYNQIKLIDPNEKKQIDDIKLSSYSHDKANCLRITEYSSDTVAVLLDYDEIQLVRVTNRKLYLQRRFQVSVMEGYELVKIRFVKADQCFQGVLQASKSKNISYLVKINHVGESSDHIKVVGQILDIDTDHKAIFVRPKPAPGSSVYLNTVLCICTDLTGL